MRLIFRALLVSTIVGLAACASTPKPKPSVASRIGLTFTIAQKPRPTVEVELTFAGASDGATVLGLPERYQGFAMSAAFPSLEVRDGTGQKLTATRLSTHQLRVEHAPGAALTVRYRVVVGDATLPARAAFLRPVVTDQLFFLAGESGLLLPAHFGERPVDITLAWRGETITSGGWRALSSISDQPSARRQMAIDELRHAVFVAGALQVKETPLGASKLVFATPATWKFNVAPIVKVAAQIVEYQRTYVAATPTTQPFLFLMLPIDQPRRGAPPVAGRTATGGIVILSHRDLDAGRPADYRRLRRVIALQTLQQWSGVANDATAIGVWLAEGFQRVLARRLLYRSSLFTVDEYAAEMNVDLADYYLNPWRDTHDSDLTPVLLADERIERAVVARGEILALLIDLEMRRKSEGRQSLDDVMRDLLRDARQTGQAFSVELITTRLSELVGSSFAEQLRVIADNRAPAQLPRDTLFPCLRQSVLLSGPFQIGFDFERSLRDRRISGVDRQSNAYAAGLRDGMILEGARVDFDNPREEVRLQIRVGNDNTEVKYQPQGAPRSVPQLSVNDPNRCDVL